jgi:hypothetical protein
MLSLRSHAWKRLESLWQSFEDIAALEELTITLCETCKTPNPLGCWLTYISLLAVESQPLHRSANSFPSSTQDKLIRNLKASKTQNLNGIKINRMMTKKLLSEMKLHLLKATITFRCRIPACFMGPSGWLSKSTQLKDAAGTCNP